MACTSCNKKVFAFQLVESPAGPFHRECFKCSVCSVLLTTQFDTVDGKVASRGPSAVNSRVGTPKLNGKEASIVVEKPVENIVEKPAEKIEKPMDEPKVENAVVERITPKEEKPVEESIDKSVEKPVEEQIEAPKSPSPKPPVEKPAEKPVEKPNAKHAEPAKETPKTKEQAQETPKPAEVSKEEKHGSHHHKHSHSDKPAPPKQMTEKPKPAVADKTAEPAVADKTAEPAVADKTAEPAVADKTAKPAVADKAQKPTEKPVEKTKEMSVDTKASPKTPETASPKTMGRRSLLRISPAQLEAAAAANERALKTGSSQVTPSPTPTPTSASTSAKADKKGKNITVEEMREMLANKSFKSNKQIEFQAELVKTKEKLSNLGIAEPVSWTSPLAKETAKKAAEMGDIVALAGISVRTGTVVEMTPLPDDLANARAAQDEIYDMHPEDLLAHVAAKLEEKEKLQKMRVEMPAWLEEKVISLRKPDGGVFECAAKDLVLYLQRDQVENLVKQEVKKREKEDEQRREHERMRAQALEDVKRAEAQQSAVKDVPPPRGSSSRADASRAEPKVESKKSKPPSKAAPQPASQAPPAPAPKEEKKKGLGGLFKKMTKK